MTDLPVASGDGVYQSDDADDVAAEELDRRLRDASQALVLGPDASLVLSNTVGYSMREPLWGLTAYDELAIVQKATAELGATAVVATTGLCDVSSLEALGVQASSDFACDRALRAARAGGPRFVLGSIESEWTGEGDRHRVESVTDETRLLVRKGAQGLVVNAREADSQLVCELQGIAEANSSLATPRPVVIDCSGRERSMLTSRVIDEARDAHGFVASVLVSRAALRDKSLMTRIQEMWPEARVGFAIDADASGDDDPTRALQDKSPLLRFYGAYALKATALAAARLGI